MTAEFVPSPADTLEIALSLARNGWHVFPVRLTVEVRPDGTTKRHKKPLVKWHDGATTDPEQVATWWGGEFARDWIGVHCEKSGLVVVDLDRGDGKNGRKALRAAGIDLPRTFNYPTRGGGSHHVYAAPDGRVLTVAKGTPVEGVDIRAGHGLMVYYGPKLDAERPPTLTPAPDWSLLDRDVDAGKLGDASATVAAWRERQAIGKPSKKARKAAESIALHDTDRDTAMRAIATIVGESKRKPGDYATLVDEVRERYTRHYPDAAADFDALLEGSVKRFGPWLHTAPIPKPERKALAERMKPTAQRVAELPKGELIEGELTDADLAEQVEQELADRFAVVRGVGVMRYDGRVWRESDEAALVEATRRILRRIRADETRSAILRGDRRREQEAKALEQRTRIVAVARLAAGILAERDPRLDAHPDLLNTPSGVVDLRTGELQPHDPALMLSKMTAAPYDPNADRSTWLRALEAVPPKVADWLQVRFGQAATGYMTSDDAMPVLMGAGHNGKTTMLNAAREALGDYAVTVPKRLLLSSPGDHPTELTTLMGARLAVLEELPEGRNLNVERLKDVLGTPVVTARRMRQDNVSWRATHSLMLSTNYLPIVAETDHGTWRRLALVVFPYRFVDAAESKRSASPNDRLRDDSIRTALSSPDAGVLAWIVEGARRWYEAGEKMPAAPKAVRQATDAWRNDADPVMGYVTERLETGVDGSAVTCADLAADFNAWLEARGHKAWSLQTINARFAGHESMRDAARRKVKFGRVTASRPQSAFRPLPPVTMAWLGLQYRDEPAGVPMSAEVLRQGFASP